MSDALSIGIIGAVFAVIVVGMIGCVAGWTP